MVSTTPTALWHEEILHEIAAADENAFQPHQQPGGDCKVIGTLPTRLRKLWALGQFYQKQAATLLVEAMYSKPDDEGARAALSRAEETAMTLRHMFWTSVRNHFNTFSNDEICLYEGWAIGVTPRNHELASLLRKLAGLGRVSMGGDA